MANILNSHKQPFKIIEIPLNKFSEEIIPHHQKVFQQYKETIKNLLAIVDKNQLNKEIKEKKRNIKQLRDLMYELDTLRTQVEDEYLDQFDSKTLSLRKIILNLISSYSDLEKTVNNALAKEEISSNGEKENQRPFEDTAKIQIHENIEELKLKERQEQLSKVENINRDVRDLNELYKSLHQLTEEQAESIDVISENIGQTQQNIETGTRSLASAHKLKAVAYPVTGAFIGGIVGGPIGLVAGLKVGAVAAVTCATAGYVGGNWFKKKTSEKVEEFQIKKDQTVNEDDTKKEI